MSALPPKADIAEGNRHVRFVPKADIHNVDELAGLVRAKTRVIVFRLGDDSVAVWT